MTDTNTPFSRLKRRQRLCRSMLRRLAPLGHSLAALMAYALNPLPTAAAPGVIPVEEAFSPAKAMGAESAPPPPEVKVVYWVGDMPEPRVRYERELIEQALERTREEFGNYRLELDRQLRSHERLTRSLTRDSGIHILNGPGWALPATDEAQTDVHMIQKPLVKGLLGYRQCIIRRVDQARFSTIRSGQDLRQFKMGQGQGWLDAAILKHNGYRVLEAPALEKLYHMLKRGRFHCLPLGIGEAEGSLAEHDPDGELTIADNLLLFYPLPVYMQLSGHDSALALRMERGLEMVIEDGTLDRLFHKHFTDKIQLLQAPQAHVIRLENPYLTGDLQSLGMDLLGTAR